MSKNGSEPAFPRVHPDGESYRGLTKRELFAAMAIGGILGSALTSVANFGLHGNAPDLKLPTAKEIIDGAAVDAVAVADALLLAIESKEAKS